MPAAFRFLGLDLRSLRPYAKSLVLPILIVAVAIAVTAPSPIALIPTLAFVAVIFVPQYLFALDERACLDTLYAALGNPRTTVVIGRHLTIALGGIVFILIGAAAAAVSALVTGERLGGAEAAVMSAIAFGMFSFVVACSTPVSFAIGQTKARPVALAVIAGLAVLIAGVNWLAPDIARDMLRFARELALVVLVLGGLLAGVALFAASAALSAYWYGRRDL